MLKSTIVFTQVTSDLVKLEYYRELTAKDIRQSIILVIKSFTEATTFLNHANQEADLIRTKNIATSLPKDLYLLAKDVAIPLEWLFDVYINARVNNIKAEAVV